MQQPPVNQAVRDRGKRHCLNLFGRALDALGCKSELSRRLNQAQRDQQTANAALDPLAKGLVLFADFEREDMVYLGPAGWLPAPTVHDQ